MAGPNLIVRQLGPIVNAFNGLRNSVFQQGRTTIAGIDDSLFPNPLQPVTPIGPPGAQPLRFPLNWGQNLNFNQREQAEYTAGQLRQLGKYILARVCIENNKDILCRMPRRVQLKPKPGETSKERASRSKNDPNLLSLNKFIDRPNFQEDWSEFLRPVLDDMLTIDSAAIFVERKKKTAKIAGLRWVDGGAITRLVTANGFTPPPPSPAYQQTWEGFPRLDLTTDQLVYRPRNIVYRGQPYTALYGMSPTEQVAKEIEIGVARLQFIYDFYAQGSIPGAVQFAPRDTPPGKIKEAQQFIDSDLAGNLAARRRIQIFQGFQEEGKSEQIWQPKEPALADVFDDIHIRKICFAYGTSPQRLQRAMNRGSAQSAQESAEEEGTLPWLSWLKGTFDYIIQILMGFDEYEVAFDPFMELDKLKQAMADGEDIKVGLYTRNEIREQRGDDPRPEPEADELNVLTGTGVLGLNERAQPAGLSTGAGGRTPKGGQQPKSIRTTAATQKTNGHTTLHGCSKHKDQYARIQCVDCVKSEIDYNQKLYHQSLENRI